MQPHADAELQRLGSRPTLKVQQGSEIVVHVINQGDLDTTVHWHGLRLENRMVPVEVAETLEDLAADPDSRPVRRLLAHHLTAAVVAYPALVEGCVNWRRAQ
jgi:Multicopper oxidase